VKTLYLLRHAKSSWGDSTIADHDRALAPRGMRAARAMAKHIEHGGIRPALVLCSSSRRTRDTLQAVAASLGAQAQAQVEDDLYGASATDLLRRLRLVEAATPSVMVLGHNPGLQDLAIELTGDGDAHAVRQLHAKFPTAALVTLDLASEWAAIGRGQAHLESIVLPRELPDP
jgi:phosphohistidine phosphatase